MASTSERLKGDSPTPFQGGKTKVYDNGNEDTTSCTVVNYCHLLLHCGEEMLKAAMMAKGVSEKSVNTFYHDSKVFPLSEMVPRIALASLDFQYQQVLLLQAFLRVQWLLEKDNVVVLGQVHPSRLYQLVMDHINSINQEMNDLVTSSDDNIDPEKSALLLAQKKEYHAALIVIAYLFNSKLFT